MADLLVIFPIFLAFVPVAVLLANGASAYLVSPLLATAAALLAGFTHILFDVPVWIVWLVIAGLQAVLFIVRPIRERMAANLKVVQTDLYAVGILGLAALMSAMASISTPAPLAWDARSIWFHHAKWLNGPAEYFLEAQFLPAGNWPDYPFTGPALMTLSWQLSGGAENFWLASRISGVLVILVGLLAVVVLANYFAPKAHFALKLGIAFTFAASLTLLADGYYNAGYQDTLQAALVSLLFALVLTMKDSRWSDLALPAVVFLLASNIKQEGFWFATGVLGLALLVQAVQKNYIPLALLAVPVVVRVGWSWFQDRVGMPDNGHTSEVIYRFPLLFSGDAEVATNLQLVFTNGIQPRSMSYILLVALSAIVLVLLGKGEGFMARIPTSLATMLAPYGVLAVAVVTYVLGQSGGLEWWLGTSYTRITATFEFLSLVAMLVTVLSLLPEAKPKPVVAQKPVSKKAKKRR
jgi:hypothetical protein